MAYFTEGWPNLSPLLDPGNLLNPGPIWGFVVLSIFSSLIAFLYRFTHKRHGSPCCQSVFFLMESVFAALLGFFYLTKPFLLWLLLDALWSLVVFCFYRDFQKLNLLTLFDIRTIYIFSKDKIVHAFCSTGIRISLS